MKIQQFIYKTYTGISPVSASEIAFEAGVNPENYTPQETEKDIENLYSAF